MTIPLYALVCGAMAVGILFLLHSLVVAVVVLLSTPRCPRCGRRKTHRLVRSSRVPGKRRRRAVPPLTLLPNPPPGV